MTRRFDIGPVVLAVGALALLVSLFLDWFASVNAWQAFELADAVLAGLAVAALLGVAGLLAPELGLVGRRALPWVVGAAFVLVAIQLVNPPPGADGLDLGLGAWMAFVATLVMAGGTLLSLGKVSLAVAVEGRERVRRVAAVDHRPPPTESNPAVEPAATRAGESLLGPRPGEEPEDA